jgi:hypothetical protein
MLPMQDAVARNVLQRCGPFFLNVRFWPKADIPSCTAHVRFRGKADMAYCSANVLF